MEKREVDVTTDAIDDNAGQTTGARNESAGASASDTEQARPEDLGRLLEDARAKADDHWDQVVRLKAELDNQHKRHARELENAHRYALERFVNELVGVWDSLDLGLAAANDGSADVAKLREGTALTLKQLADAMGKFGVEQFDPAGEPFDPEKHQAVATQPSADVAPNTVLTVIQKGYSLNGRLVRPAMVMVSAAAPASGS